MASWWISLPLHVLLILCAMLHASSASGGDLLMLDRFHRWMSAHGRSYPSANEKRHRLEVYRRNVELIEATNMESERLGYELGENEFTDLTNEEFVARYTGAAVPTDAGDAIAHGMGSIITTMAGDVNEGTVDLNTSVFLETQNVDWRDQGAVTSVKHQGSCGCCWAFATVGTIESLIKIKGGKLMDLSMQELLDCDLLGQSGCSSGYVNLALQWVIVQGGAVALADYPYQEVQGKCKIIDRARRVGKITSFQKLSGEPQLKLAVFSRPVAVIMDAAGVVMQNYKTGIYKGPCTTKQNHAVVLIGYGVNAIGEEYWILKNSWGTGWGQNGFFYMRRGADGAAGLCGVEQFGYNPNM